MKWRDLFQAAANGEKTKIIVLRESIWESFIVDFVTFGMIGLLAWLNHALGWDSDVINFFAIIAVLVQLPDARETSITVPQLIAIVEHYKKGLEGEREPQ